MPSQIAEQFNARLISLTIGAIVLTSVAGTARADSPDTAADSSQEVVVIGTTPIPGATIDADKIPAHVESLSAADLARTGTANLTGALNSQVSSVSVSDTLADPFQPDILYRGFEGSPVLGTPQGLAVYQNGVRVNEPFGDAVNWDLIPAIAIDHVDFVSANPVYGLNALGGAGSISMKNGFTYQGAEAELSAGSFQRHNAAAQFGANDGTYGVYFAANFLNQRGWRYFAADSVHQIFAALSAHGELGTLDLSYTRDDNQLFGQGAAPAQSLALSTENTFTGPQSNFNRLDMVTLDGSLKVAAGVSVQGAVYYRNYRQSVQNGNTTNYTACITEEGAGLLCQSDGVTPLANAAGQPLPDISSGGTIPIGENDSESIHSIGDGGSLQLTDSQSFAGHDNQLTVGASVDASRVDFQTAAQIGVIDSHLNVLPADLYVDTPEGPPGGAFGSVPTILAAFNNYYGAFITDTFDVSSALSVTASGRYNIAKIDLDDRRGSNLNGTNRYTHFNPAVGAAYKLGPSVTAYGNISVTNRTPNASEIECSDPLLPCLLPANLAGDPPVLRQVIAHTYEVGLRGRAGSDPTSASLTWSLGVFRTSLSDDIYAISTSVSSGFFQNIGATRRQGVEAGAQYRWSRGSAYINYSYVDATFESALVLSSPSSPTQDRNGNIQVEPGDHLPLIPRHRLKAGVDYNLVRDWTVGGTFVLVSDAYYKGDESNQNPTLAGHHVFGFHSAYHFGQHAEVFVTLENAFNERYFTYGLFSDPTGIGAPGVPVEGVTNGPGVDNRFLSPAEPRALFVGLRARL